MGLPPPPPGFKPDPLATVQGWGAQITNGFRTPADTERIRRQGYRPARNSKHLDADALDLAPGKSGLSMGTLHARASEFASQWPGARVLNERHHIHMQLPGWGGAPGLPAPPPGFEPEGLAPPDAASPAPGAPLPVAPPPEPVAPTQQQQAEVRGLFGRRGSGVSGIATPPVPAGPDLEGFRARAGAIASERAMPLDTRIQALGSLAREAGLPIPEEDLRRVAENGLAMVELQVGENGSPPRLTTVRAAPPKAPPAEAFRPSEEDGKTVPSPRFRGVNEEVRRIINGANPTWAAVAQHLKGRGLLDVDIAAIKPTVDKVIQFRRETGRPYQNAISLDRIAADAPAETWTPEEALAATKDKIRASLGDQKFEGPKDIGDMSTRELWTDAWRNLGHSHADRLGRQADFIPVLGGGIAMEEGGKAIGRGEIVGGLAQVALGSVDLAGVGPGAIARRAGKEVIDAAALRTVLEQAAGDVDRVANYVRTRADEALAAGGRVTFHVEGRAVPITQPGLVDDQGRAWGSMPLALPILRAEKGGANRLEIEMPEPARDAARKDAVPGNAAGSPVDETVELPPPPPGFTPESGDGFASGMRPQDVLPIPDNRVRSVAEAAAIPSPRQEMAAPNPWAELQSRRIGVRGQPGKSWNYRGPLDAEAFLRRSGGLKDSGGELRNIGITNNQARPFAPAEHRLGKILDNQNGLDLDEAGLRLWEAGYFPNHVERPTVDDVVELLRDSRLGSPTYHPDDFEEVARFDQAMAARGRVETAAQEGRPLVEDVGRPVGLDDMRAIDRQIPATAFEDLPEIASKVGSVNLSNIRNAGDISRAMVRVEEELRALGMGPTVRTHAEVLAEARASNMTVKQFLEAPQGRAFTEGERTAARILHAKAFEEMTALAHKSAQTGAPADLLAWLKSAQVATAVHHKMNGLAADAARALSSYRIPVGPNMISGKALNELLDGMGGSGRIEDIRDAVIELQRKGVNAEGVTTFAAKAILPGYRDKILELFYANMLSAGTTHVANLSGNALAFGLSIPEYGLASLLGQLRRGSNDRVFAEEIGGYTSGMVGGAREGLRAFWHTFKTGETVDPLTKLDLARPEAIGGKAGYVIRTPLRLLAAEDEFAKAVARQATIGRLAVKEARKEGLKGAAMSARAAEIASNPTPQMLEQSVQFSRYITFTDEPGAINSIGIMVKNKIPELSFFFPFINTVGKLFKFSAERSPVGLVMPSVWRELRAGGERRDIAVARLILGSSIGALAYSAAKKGGWHITGGEPLDGPTREMLRDTGWQPHSVKIGDAYYGIRKFDPLSTIVAFSADLATYDKYMTPRERERTAATLAQLISRNVTDSVFLGDVGEFFQMLEDPADKVPGKLGSIAGTLLVPNLIAQPTASYDPVQRDQKPDPEATVLQGMMESLLNRVKARVPGLRDNLPAKQNVWGEDVPNDGRAGLDLISPLPLRKDRSDPVLREMLNEGLRVGKPGKTVGHITLTREEHRAYTRLSGRYIREDLTALVEDPEWKRQLGGERRNWFEEVKRSARADARADLGLGDDESDLLPPPPPGFQ